MMHRIPDRTALLVVDMQRDFMRGGALEVEGADALIPRINHYVAQFANAGAPVFFARDWHPQDHCSFTSQGGRWPAHCVAGSTGAEFDARIPIPGTAAIVSKGSEPTAEGYSAFEGSTLAELLHARQIDELWIAGVATEFCVRASVLDALRAGFRVKVLVDAIQSVERKPGDGDQALAEMLAAGASGHAWSAAGYRSR
jgi:nicotinamidase/pyrazinamidase